jgi:CheY-like chemotaxis protein
MSAHENGSDDHEELSDLTGLRVVVVEDDDDARELLVGMLIECGAEVSEAASAVDAIELVRRLCPDVLVSDIGLPDHDGYYLIRAVRALSAEEGGRVPAIALTGYADLADSHAALRAGYQVHVAKPIDIGLLTQAVANVAGMKVVDLST